jgi:hypothetical protein
MADTGLTLLDAEARLARLEGVRDGLREGVQTVEMLRQYPAPSERHPAAGRVLKALHTELTSRLSENEEAYRKAVKDRDALLYPDRGGDPDGDSLVGREV